MVNPVTRRTRLLVLASLWALLCFNAFAQTGAGVLLGTITDPSGAPLPGVKLTATNMETQLVVSAETDQAGEYRILGLPPGHYELKASLTNFATEVHRGIALVVSQQLELNMAMKVGTVGQEITVSGGAPLVEASTSSISGVVGEQQMRELPLNGRDIYQLVQLQPGVSPNLSAGPSLWGKGGINKVAVNGQRAFNNNMTIDGMDANDPLYNQSPGGASGVMLGVDAIQEFRIYTDTFSAEYGRDSGSVIQTITRSGTNDLHGSVFEFLRNSALDSKNYFDLPDSPIPPFIRNQFGGSVGGPVKKDKAFFFISYEGFREGEGLTSVSTVPDALAREGLLPASATPGNPTPICTPTNESGCINIGVNPLITPYMNIIAAANGPDFGNGTAQITSTERRITNEDYVMGRFDYIFSDSHTFFARYIHDASSSLNPYLSTLVPGFPGNQDVGNQYLTIQDQKFLNTNLMNLFAFGFNRTGYIAQPEDTFPDLSISLSPNRPIGVLAIAGIGAIGNNLVYPVGGISNTYQAQDSLSWTHGPHAFKFGFEYRRLQMNGPFDLYVNGEYAFAAFGANVSNNPALEDFLEAKPLIYLGTQPSLSNSDRGLRQNWLSGYAQDDWRITPRLTLNLGLRYEFYSNPTEEAGRIANVIDPLTDPSATIGKFMKSTPTDLFAPRVGLAWNLTPDGKTVLRAGGGIFYDQLYGNLYGNDRFFPPFYGGLQVLFPTFLDPLGGASPAAASIPTSLTYTPKWPTVYQYNLNIQRELTANTVLKVAYVGARGNDLVRLVDKNPFNPAIGARPNPNFGSLFRYETDAQSFYNGLQVTLEQRLSKGLNFQANYTYSHSVDDSSGAEPSDDVNDGVATQDPNDRKGSRGRSGFDIRHNLVFNLLYDLPIGPDKALGGNLNGLAGKIVGGWQISSIGTFHSNVPFTPVLGFDNAGTQPFFNYTEVPNVVGNPFSGTCPNGAPVRTASCWFNPAAYAVPTAGTFGNAGRDSIPGPAFADLDFALLKNTVLREGMSLQFRVECFNLLNHPNFSVPVNTTGPNGAGGNGDAVFLGPTSPAGNAGEIFSTVSSSRQIQFGLRFTF